MSGVKRHMPRLEPPKDDVVMLQGEVCRIDMTDGHTIILGLRKPRGGESDPTEDAKMFAEAIGGAGMPEDMRKALTEGMTKMAQAQHEKHMERAAHETLASDYMLELTEREYANLGRPGIGYTINIPLEVSR